MVESAIATLCISIFKKIGYRSVKTVHINLLAKKNANFINLELPIRISKNQAFRTCTTP